MSVVRMQGEYWTVTDDGNGVASMVCTELEDGVSLTVTYGPAEWSIELNVHGDIEGISSATHSRGLTGVLIEALNMLGEWEDAADQSDYVDGWDNTDTYDDYEPYEYMGYDSDLLGEY